jgi:hypothetical protein
MELITAAAFIHSSVALQPFVGPWPLLQFRNLFLHRRYDSLDEWSARRKATTCTQDNTNTNQTNTQKSIPWVGFEPTIQAFERAKTVHALDHAATVIGDTCCLLLTNHKQTPTHEPHCSPWNKYRQAVHMLITSLHSLRYRPTGMMIHRQNSYAPRSQRCTGQQS